MTPLVSSRKKEKKEFQDEKLPETSGETELMHVESLKPPESYPTKMFAVYSGILRADFLLSRKC